MSLFFDVDIFTKPYARDFSRGSQEIFEKFLLSVCRGNQRAGNVNDQLSSFNYFENSMIFRDYFQKKTLKDFQKILDIFLFLPVIVPCCRARWTLALVWKMRLDGQYLRMYIYEEV